MYDFSFSSFEFSANNGGVVGEFFADGSGLFLGGTPSVYFRASTDHPILLGTNSTVRAIITNTGNFGIGLIDPSYPLQVNGAVAGTGFVNTCSKDFKEDIQRVGDASYPVMLAKLLDMDLTTYKYKKEYGGDGDVKQGFIAEDMPEEVLSKDGKGVDVYELLTLTIGAMKAQQKKIAELEALNAKLAEVMERLEVLEK